MAILKIAVLGNPILRAPAEPVKNIKAPDIQRLIDDMLESMEESHGVGLAAPQVHRALQIVTIDAEEEDNPITASPTILINPRIVPAIERMEEGWEGCLSVPNIRGRVPRYTEVDVEAFDRRGKRLQFRAKDFFARVIQHECDHLTATVFLDRMQSLETLTFLDEFTRYWLPSEEGEDGEEME
jgi:peptide deformylase